MRRVYIETSVPSFYFETRTELEVLAWRDATRRWWDRYRHQYDICTSMFTLAELAAVPDPKSRECLDLLSAAEVLDLPPGLNELIDYYIVHRLVPQGPDAAHLAMSSLHGIDADTLPMRTRPVTFPC